MSMRISLDRNDRIELGDVKMIALWGAGYVSRVFMSEKKWDYSVSCIIDSDINKCGIIYGDIPIVSPQVFKKEYASFVEGVLICINDENSISDIYEFLKNTEVSRVGVFSRRIDGEADLLQARISWIETGSKEILHYIEFHVADQCNLKCTGCSHFSNLFCNEDESYMLDELVKDMERLSELYHIRKIRIMGGEPFLKNNFDEYIRVTRRFFVNSDIHIVTNGLLLLKMSAEKLSVFNECDVEVDVSLYKPTVEIRELLVSIFDENGIRYRFTEVINDFLRILNQKGDSDCKEAYMNCKMRDCHMIRKGKLYVCPMEALIYKYIQYFGCDDFCLDYNSFGVAMHEEGFNSYLFANDVCKKPLKLCSYCSENGGKPYKWSTSPIPGKDDWII